MGPIKGAGRIAPGENIQIQSPWTELGRRSFAAVVCLEFFEAPGKLSYRHIGIHTHHQVQKIRAIEADRFALVNRRNGQFSKPTGQSIQRRADMAIAFNITADTDVYTFHARAPRSILTPTERAAGTAPGLLNVSLSQRTPNSPCSKRATSS